MRKEPLLKALVKKLKCSTYVHVTIITVKSQFARESEGGNSSYHTVIQ